MDYTKFRLKPDEEILEAFSGKEKIFLISCKKCYREYTHEDGESEECSTLPKFLKDNNKKFTGCIDVDFLCNLHHTKQILAGANLKDSQAVGVSSCGLGIQSVAEIVDSLPVYAIADSIPQANNNTCLTAYHGIALTPQKCAGCAQCYLNLTGGICPIVDCSKSLVNGQCGGAKNGKCEVKSKKGTTKDCAWEKIYFRLSKQNTQIDNITKSIQLRDNSKPMFSTVNTCLKTNIEKRNQNFYGGIYPFEFKETTEYKAIETFPEPDLVIIPLSQHTGAPCEPIVKAGDKVKKGQKIGDSKSFIYAPVHSSVSGEVISIEETIHPLIQKKVFAVKIKNDKKNELDKSIKSVSNFESLSKDELIDIIRDKGIVGMGGAMFPTYVKLQPPKPVDTLLINGCECEPYLTSDYRVMVEKSGELITGIKILMKILDVNKAIIAIEGNKPEAIEKLKIKVSGFDKITIAELPTKYPQGAEKTLIKKILGREVPAGKLPLDIGVVVSNVGTVAAINDAAVNGMPLIERIVTVSGKKCIKPGNYLIKIGTPIKNIIDFCFSPDSDCVFKMGGPLMGVIQTTADSPVIKGSSGLIAVKKQEIEPIENRACIKCGRCVDVCPMELYPLFYALFNTQHRYEDSEKQNIKSCIECGCCDYICSSKIPLVKIIKDTKLILQKPKC
ncbi:MAG: electron transport complex subunit RsxC [Elusimicrobiota bacterium]